MVQTPLHRLAQIWQSGDARQIAALFSAAASWVIDGESLDGDEVPAVIQASLAARPHTRIFVRRAFYDSVEPDWWAGEWVFRTSADGREWLEIEQGLLWHMADGRIDQLRTHNDHGSVRSVELDEPLRHEDWVAQLPQRTRDMTREEILAVHRRHTSSGWAIGDAETVTRCHAPASRIQTAFETVIGHDNLRRSVRAYFENYADTQIEVRRMIYNGDYLAISQTWTCTNRKTGIRASDQDLNIGVLQDGVFWRWREYYDSRTSAQTAEQTVFGRAQLS